MLLLGEVGTGKTTICCHVHNYDPYLCGYINYPYFTEIEFLQTVNKVLGLPETDGSRYDTTRVLNDYLLKQYAKGKPVVLIIDEAHRLGLPILDEILILNNLQASEAHLLQIVLAGQPTLLDMLRHPRLISLNQRIGVRCTIPRLDRANTVDYVCHRLTRAGCTDASLFSTTALDLLWERSLGTPRLINQLAERALHEAYQKGKKRVGRRELLQVADDPLYLPLYGGKPRQRTMKTTLAGAALALCVGISLGLYHFGLGGKYLSLRSSPGIHRAPENYTFIKKPIVLPELVQSPVAEPEDGIIVEPDVTVPVAVYDDTPLVPPGSRAAGLSSGVESVYTEDELPELKLSAIAWDQNPERSIAVVNDRIVHEGDFLGEVRILRIKPNQVVLLRGDEHIIKKINKANKGHVSQTKTVKNDPEAETPAITESSEPEQAEEPFSLLDYTPIINFDYRTSKIVPEAYEELDRIATIAKLSPHYEIIVRGYTDNVGSYLYNEKLSRLRAKIVRDYLIKKGLTRQRIITLGMGENNPLMENDTPEGRAANLRVEIELLPTGDYDQ
jgi:type II secretory pathway predicted ATPase ExeA/outer membrane protein OmpA-like peptidoglycan-associated protein